MLERIGNLKKSVMQKDWASALNTATGSPQLNAYVERAFQTLMGRARAMMNFAGFTTEKEKQLWCEADNTATMLDDILVHEQNSSPPYTMPSSCKH